jgi:malonate transporter and related proteins
LIESALALALPLAIGWICGALKLFGDPSAAIDPLNRYALYVAFPALVCAGLMDRALAFPSSIGFWAIVPIAFAAVAILARLLARRQSPTIALVCAFGNVAYLGLPVVERALGEDALPIASLAVAIHVVIALTIGPLLLLRWSGGQTDLRALSIRVLKQPLVWAPIAGLALRLAPAAARDTIAAVLAPIGQSAAPVALVLLGLYLHTHRERMRKIDLGDLAHVLFKLALLPAATIGLALLFHRASMLTTGEAQVLVVLSAMPAAITTFSIAHDVRTGAERTSRAIVLTTLFSAIAIPIALWLVQAPPSGAGVFGSSSTAAEPSGISQSHENGGASRVRTSRETARSSSPATCTTSS